MRKFYLFLRIKIRHIRLRLSNRPANDLSRKQQILLEIGWSYNCSTFIETGTFLGDTIEIMRRYFDRVVSVEVSRELYNLNKQRFEKRKNVFLYQGDSGELMSEMLEHKTGRALFWLDAHYSGPGTARGAKECPLTAELESIAKYPRNDHCILIDDKDALTGKNDYPPLHQVKEMLLQINPNFEISEKNNILIALPPIHSISL